MAVHAPSREGNQRNYHAHILTTTRVVGADGALGAKTRELDDKKTGPAHVEALRELWAIQVNHALQRIEAAARVDHRSHARRGLDAVPSITMGAGATALERRAQRAHDGREGGPDVLPPVTRRGQRQAAIAAANAAVELARAEAEAARELAEREQQAEAARGARERRAEAMQAAREQAERERWAEAARMAQEAARMAVERPLEVARAADPERERWRTMSMEALRSEIEKLRPPSVAAAAKLLPRVRAEQAAADKSLSAASQATGKASEASWTAHRLEQEIAAIRAEPGLIAKLVVWLHDRELRQNAALAQREAALADERRQQAQALEARTRHQAAAVAARVREQAAEREGLLEVEAELRPARVRYEAARAVLRERAREAKELRQEVEQRARLRVERERERWAEAARNAAKIDTPEQNLDGDEDGLDRDDDWMTP